MVSSPLVRALGYPKFKSGIQPRVLVMKSSYFIIDDVLAAARRVGWAIHELPTPLGDKGEAGYIKSMLMALVEFRPDFLLTINHIGFDEEGVLASLLEDYAVPLASWFVDHPLPILAGAEQNARASSQVFCFERTALSWLRRAGFEDPQYLPTASNADTFQPSALQAARASQLGVPLALVAGSWWKKAHASFEPGVHQLAREMTSGRNIDRAFLRDDLEALLASPECAGNRQHSLAAQAALAETSMRTRVAFVLALRDLNPVVYGDEHWKDLVRGVELRGPVHPTRDLPTLFAACEVNLNVTAEQMPTAVNQRVWDVPGVGGFLLTDAQHDVLEHFTDGEDVAIYHDLEEARDKARFYLDHPAARERIARKGRARVDAAHRTHHRLERMEGVMRKRFG